MPFQNPSPQGQGEKVKKMTKDQLLEIVESLEDVTIEEVFPEYSEEEKAIQDAIKILYQKIDEM